MSRFAPAVPFEHPFNEETLGELRWYLEEYLRFPYGIEPEKAAKVEQKFQVWGQQLFELVFRGSEKAREFFQEATRERLEYCEIGITSDDPNVLNLPWELLYSPDYQFLAPSLAGMYRSLNNFAVRAELEALPQDKLNILLVIARPYGERDISLKTIARPMLEALKPIRQQVSLKVLRPPSFDEFQQELNAHKGFYHIVHFDGHGDFDPNSRGFQHSFGSAGQGVLVFEHLDGSPQVITAAQIAQNLRDCDIPIFILNACKSAQEGSGSFSSVATQLVSLGAKGVVAMAYSVYADAAKHFIGRLYEQLIRGVSLDRAVADGRKEVLNKPLRPSPKGKLRLADWIVPVLYQQETYAPFMPADSDTIPDLDQFLDEPTATNLVELPEEGSYGFVGRDYDILRLERAFRQSKIVLLQGMGGVGKTELACGFARWLDETQGRSQIFFLSFEHGAGLSHVINQVGRTVWQDKFSQYSFEQQQAAVLKYLKTKPCLLIWDNFEPVAGFPTGNEPLLLDDERDELKRFLKNLRDGASWILITSRREERWLDCGYTLVHLQGLSRLDAEEFAAQILQKVGVDRAKLLPEYLDLLKLLGGHPLSLRVVLPHLKTQSSTQLIEALQQGLDTFQGIEEEGKDKSLTVSLDYSFSRLSERTQRHLPFLALFSERINVNWLHAFSSGIDDNFGQAYRAVFGEDLQKTDWIALLDEAVDAGILEHPDLDIYRIHPTLPWYLRQKLETNDNSRIQKIDALEKKLLIVYALLADNYRKQLVSNSKLATFVLQLEEPNLLKNLQLAEQCQDWDSALRILGALGEVYQRIGPKREFRALRQKALNQIGLRLIEVKSKGQDAFNFWMYLRGQDANEAGQSGKSEEESAIHREILDELLLLDDSSVNDKIAVAYNGLGVAALAQRRFDDAVVLLERAIQIYESREDEHSAALCYHNLGSVAYEQHLLDKAIIHYEIALHRYEKAGDDYNAAREHHQLGNIACMQRRFDDAAKHYQTAIQIYEDAEDVHKVALNYHGLGIVEQEQQRLDKAKEWYKKAVQILEDAGDRCSAAREYHQLGIVAFLEKNLEDATIYYEKALHIYESVEDTYSAANEYHQLGMVAQDKQQFDDAIAHYRTAIQIYRSAGDTYNTAKSYHQIGVVKKLQKQLNEAISYFMQALLIFIQFQDEYGTAFPLNQLGQMLKDLGESKFRNVWKVAIGVECPEGIYLAIQKASKNQEE